MNLISPVNCDHNRRLFIHSLGHSGTDGHSYECVEVCEDCGIFLISGHNNHHHFKVSFWLVSDEHVEAAKKPVEYYKEAE